MTDLEVAKQFAADNVVELAQELIEWEATGLLRDGRLRALAAQCKFAGESYELRVAKHLAERAAIEVAAKQTV